METLWIRHLLAELDIVIIKPAKVLCDNIFATYIAANPVLQVRSKHIKVDYYFLRDMVSCDDLVVQCVPTQLQSADYSTKSLPAVCYLFLKSNSSVHPLL